MNMWVSQEFSRFELGSRNWRGLLIAGLGCILVGCGPKIVWSSKTTSSNGHWIAGAKTKVWSGPGAAASLTSVYLALSDDESHLTDVVSYPEDPHDPRPEVEWRTDRELVVRVPDPDGLILQTILFSDVHISVEALHKKPAALSPETDTLQR
jgi:hypothetical protein